MKVKTASRKESEKYQIHMQIQATAHSFFKATEMLTVITDNKSFPSDEMGIYWTERALYSLDKYIYTQLRTWREKKMSIVDRFLAYGV